MPDQHTVPEINPFSTLDRADELLSALPVDVAANLTIAGGQALVIWAEQYLLDHMTGYEYAHLASDDLDLLGRRADVEACARAWGGRAEFPSPFDPTPQTAIVFLEENGVTEAVDFLSHIYGLRDHQVARYCDKLQFGENLVAVMSPPLCLKSRIANLDGLRYSKEKSERECTRIKLAASTCRWYLIDLLESGQLQAAKKVIRYLLRNIYSTREAVSVEAKYGVNFDHCLPKAIQAYLPITWERYLPLWQNKHRRKVASLKERLTQLEEK